MEYSIIIPHYNTPELLARCLSSIPARDDVEVIVVDDGSRNECVRALRTMETAGYVHICYSPHGGAGRARNKGLEMATGRKIIFADADDYFGRDFGSILNDYRTDRHDVAVFAVTSVFRNGQPAGRHVRYMGFLEKALRDPSPENIRNLLFRHISLWGKIFSSGFLKRAEARCEEVMISEDVMFCVKCAQEAESVKLDLREMYVVTVTPGSLTNRWDEAAFLTSFNVMLRANNYLCSKGLHKYQFSALYFLGMSPKYGIKGCWTVIKGLVKNRSNILIGLSNLLHYKEVLKRHHPILTQKKILAVASKGGHWAELLRITRPMEEHFDICYVSTSLDREMDVMGRRFRCIGDFSRSDAVKCLPIFLRSLQIVLKEKPNIVISTGAAPGLMMLFAGWLLGRKTIWVDSLANVERLSVCGRVASHFASRTYVQWKDLQRDGKTIFAGNVLNI